VRFKNSVAAGPATEQLHLVLAEHHLLREPSSLRQAGCAARRHPQRRSSETPTYENDPAKRTIRVAASTHAFSSGTSAIRTYPRPGFSPCASRARYRPGSTVT